MAVGLVEGISDEAGMKYHLRRDWPETTLNLKD